MSDEVRIGRTEQKVSKNAHRKDATWRQHHHANNKRSAGFGDMNALIEAIVTGQPVDVDAAIELLYDHYRYGGIAQKDFAARIFDPGLASLARLPLGLLDQKEELVPQSLIPDSAEALRVHCERMIVLNRDPALLEIVTQGWPGVGSGISRFETHLADMGQIRSDHPPLYRHLVSGRHRAVVLAMRTGSYAGQGRKPPLKVHEIERLRRALVCQALLWCAHDLQLMLARNAVAIKDPVGDLFTSTMEVLAPLRVLNETREWRGMLDDVLSAYRAHRQAGRDNRHINESDLNSYDPVRRLRKGIEFEATKHGIDPAKGFERLDDLIDRIAMRLQGANEDFLRKTAQAKARGGEPGSFQALWFSGLSCLQASCVSVLRYVQAEHDIAAMIDAQLPRKGQLPNLRDGVALPAFRRSALRPDWGQRAKELIHPLRREILPDKDFESRSKAGGNAMPSDGAAGAAITKAARFLEDRGERLIGDHLGDEHSARRTFYLLDIIPEHRLAV